MIFITVGTHEQPFDRLLKYMDRFIDENDIAEEIICQSGYSTYMPRNFKVTSFLKHTEILNYIDEARLVITHGGPSSFIPVLAKGKEPVVVPRKAMYSEHVNNHQVDFCRKVNDTQHTIKLIENYSDFKNALLNKKKHTSSFTSHNRQFCDNLEQLIRGLK